MAIHHLDCGTMCPIAAPLTGSAGKLWARGLLVCHCMLVETDHGLVLIETGLGEAELGASSRLPTRMKMLMKPGSESKTAVEQVKALGYAASDVQHIFLTHLDLDHAGGLVDFPQAQVHLLRKEHDAAMNPIRSEKMRYIPGQWLHGPKWQLYDQGGDSWFGFASVRPIAELGDDFAIVPITGHSPGHCAVAVKTGAKWLMHCGDALFHRHQLQTPPKTPFGLRMFERLADFDRNDRVQNADRLRALHAAHADEVTIVCAHDSAQLLQCQTGQ